jgi:hypothetical protein
LFLRDGVGVLGALSLNIGLNYTIGSFRRLFLRDGVGVLGALSLDIGLNYTIRSFGRLLLRDGVGVLGALALDIGLDYTIGSFGRLLLRDGVGVLGALALDNSTLNLREMLSDWDASNQRRHKTNVTVYISPYRFKRRRTALSQSALTKPISISVHHPNITPTYPDGHRHWISHNIHGY